MATSYHNHTRWSDGSATVAETVAAAAAAGLGEVGVSDHFMLHPAGVRFDWRLTAERLDEYVADVQAAAAHAPLPVRLGIEADFFPETVNEVERLLRPRPFDYVIGSVHIVAGIGGDGDFGAWSLVAPDAVAGAWALYWEHVRAMAESRVYDIAAHLDLPKRFAGPMPEAARPAALAALDAIAAAGMALEVNTSGAYLPHAEAYPSPALLRAACARGIPVVVNADAHRPEHLARGLADGERLARAAGYTSFVRVAGPRRLA